MHLSRVGTADLTSCLLVSEQVKQMHDFGKLLVFGVPVVLFVMNLMWFGKIIKGLRKTLAKRQ